MKTWLCCFFGVSFFATPLSAVAYEIPLPDIIDLVSRPLLKELTRSVGALTAHRPYQGATPLGNLLGLDFSAEVTLSQISPRLIDELKANGVSADLSTRTIPVPKLHIHKGLGPRLDAGFSYLGYREYRIYGADLKWTPVLPTEGITLAYRVCLTRTAFSYVTAHSLSNQVLISRKLGFAEPYLGVEYSRYHGRVNGSQTKTIGGVPTLVTINANNIHSDGGSSFLGLALRVPGLGLKWTLEGSYSFIGAHTLGTTIGFGW